MFVVYIWWTLWLFLYHIPCHNLHPELISNRRCWWTLDRNTSNEYLPWFWIRRTGSPILHWYVWLFTYSHIYILLVHPPRNCLQCTALCFLGFKVFRLFLLNKNSWRVHVQGSGCQGGSSIVFVARHQSLAWK